VNDDQRFEDRIGEEHHRRSAARQIETLGRGVPAGGGADRSAQVQGAAVRRSGHVGAVRVRGQRGTDEQRHRARLPGGGHRIADRLAAGVAQVRRRHRRRRGAQREVRVLDDVRGDVDSGIAVPAGLAVRAAVPDVQDVVSDLVFRADPAQRFGVRIRRGHTTVFRARRRRTVLQ